MCYRLHHRASISHKKTTQLILLPFWLGHEIMQFAISTLESFCGQFYQFNVIFITNLHGGQKFLTWETFIEFSNGLKNHIIFSKAFFTSVIMISSFSPTKNSIILSSETFALQHLASSQNISLSLFYKIIFYENFCCLIYNAPFT